jgi:hypothetical protein
MEHIEKPRNYFKILICTLIGLFLAYEILTCGGIFIYKDQPFCTKEISKNLPNNISLVYAPTIHTCKVPCKGIPFIYEKRAAIPYAVIRYDFYVDDSVSDICVLDINVDGIKKDDLWRHVDVWLETMPTGQKFATVEIVNIIEFCNQNIAVSGVVIDKPKEETLQIEFDMEFEVIPLTETRKIVTGWTKLFGKWR